MYHSYLFSIQLLALAILIMKPTVLKTEATAPLMFILSCTKKRMYDGHSKILLNSSHSQIQSNIIYFYRTITYLRLINTNSDNEIFTSHSLLSVAIKPKIMQIKHSSRIYD